LITEARASAGMSRRLRRISKSTGSPSSATVFDDPLFVLQDASRNEEQRDAVIGFSSAGRLLTVVHVEFDGEFTRIISAWHASPSEEAFYDQ
jgi:uncharacterized protein